VTERPTRSTVGGRAYLDLRRLASAAGRPTAEFLQLYALEGFLTRLLLSQQTPSFILKGGVLLAAFDARRPTRDVDLAASGITSDPEVVRHSIVAVLEVEFDDGLEFRPSEANAEVIRDGEEYSGVRIMLPCTLASARLDFHVDVSVGDPILPPPALVRVPRLLGGEALELPGYSLTMVLAEKLVTAIQRGVANTRWRDFADIATLARGHSLDAGELMASIVAVLEYRAVNPRPLAQVLAGFGESGQAGWARWRRKTLPDDGLPESFAVLLDEVFTLVDPLLAGEVLRGEWSPERGGWES
jgi:hypothetical protein